MMLIKKAATTDNDKPVVIEIPDMRRVLQTAAFEDIYYEHCSYFTPGTFARFLRHIGFGISDINLVYQDQYLIAESNPNVSKTSKLFSIEESLDETRQLIDQFQRELVKKLKFWTQFFKSANENNEKIAIWGSGSKCVSFFSAIGITKEISMVVDINPNRRGKYIPGIAIKIASPQELIDLNPDKIIIMNKIYETEIRQQLIEFKITADIMTL
ncbi:MAG: hypothetical protein JKX94_10615 [Sneathiella sp.]|nr:hypothetical protein [Sneathiella sp.]